MFCKLIYALKLIMVGVIVYHMVMVKSDALEAQCYGWMSKDKIENHNKGHNSTIVNVGPANDTPDEIDIHKLLTSKFYCNHLLNSQEWVNVTLNIIEIVYCMFCMAIYLLVVYWHKNQ